MCRKAELGTIHYKVVCCVLLAPGRPAHDSCTMFEIFLSLPTSNKFLPDETSLI